MPRVLQFAVLVCTDSLGSGQGHSPVKFPRILGIEAVGVVEEAPGNEFEKGTIVATAMGGLGRQFDGGYAEYTCVPAGQIVAIKTQIDWTQLGKQSLLASPLL